MLKKHLVLLTISLVMLMESVDSSIINTSIPIMAKSLHSAPLDLKLALISYLLSISIFIPISGWMADKYGSKKVFIVAVSIFTISSLLCGFSHELSQLILFRFMQGMGSSMSLPVGRLILLRSFPRHEMISKMSLVIIIASLGGMMGPVIGGFISSYYSWPWVFWINIPIGIFTLFMAHFFLPSCTKKRVHHLDKPGFIMFGLALATLTFGLSSLSESFFSVQQSFIMIGVALLLFITYGLHSRKSKYPIVNLKLFEIKTFKLSFTNNIVFRIIIGGVPFILPLMLQIGLNYSPEGAGTFMTPIALGVLSMKIIDIYILRRFGYRQILLCNTMLIGCALASFGFIDQHSSLLSILLRTYFFGLFMSMQYACLNSLGYANVDEEYLSSATSIMGTIQQIGLSFGVALSAILLRASSAYFQESADHIGMKTFHISFFILSCLVVFLLLSLRQLSAQDGQEML
jgi:EmrB/QacA subfamily drug resistance transporter